MEEKSNARSSQMNTLKGRRDFSRSNKPPLNNTKEEKPVINEQEVDM
jgi:hypothetical protein